MQAREDFGVRPDGGRGRRGRGRGSVGSLGRGGTHPYREPALGWDDETPLVFFRVPRL